MGKHLKGHQNGEAPVWLEKLQEESWQAEILISGGAFVGIIGLFNSIGTWDSFLLYSTKMDPTFIGILLTTAFFILIILAEGFLLHLILRGYWVGMIGLAYVFPKGINQERLAFQGKFSTFIKSNSNIPYLVKLDKLCSLVFAFTFFAIFSLIGFMLLEIVT